MGRGYSATRSKSARPALKQKRERSSSIGKLREQVERSASRAIQQRKTPLPGTVVVKEGEGEDEEGNNKVTGYDSDDEASEADDETVIRQDVLGKYKTAGKIVDETMDMIVEACVDGASTFDLCALGDDELYKRCKNVFAHTKAEDGRKLDRGVCFPTNVSVNNVLCNHAPFTTTEAVTVKAGDVVKVHFGIHIDGYPVSAAKTIVVPGAEEPISESAAKAIQAAQIAMAGMIRLMRPGTENGDITDFIHHVGSHFGVEPLEGVLSTRTKRWITDTLEAVISRRVVREDPQQDVAVTHMKENTVWCLDVAFTDAPSYKLCPVDTPINIFRKNEITHFGDPRVRAAEMTLGQMRHYFHNFPFSTRHFDEPLKARLGIATLRKVDMLDLFPALESKRNTVTARFSCTVCITNKKIHVLCGDPIMKEALEEMVSQVPQDVAELLGESLSLQKTGGEKSKKKRRQEKAE